MGEAFASVFKIFTEPGKVMAQAASEKRFWIPLTMIVLLTTLFAPFTAPILHKDQISMMEKSPEMISKIPAEKWEEMKAYNAKKAIPMNILRGLFIIPIALLFVAGLTNFAATLSGVEINFSQAFSMTVFSSLVDFFWGGWYSTYWPFGRGASSWWRPTSPSSLRTWRLPPNFSGPSRPSISSTSPATSSWGWGWPLFPRDRPRRPSSRFFLSIWSELLPLSFPP